MGYEVLRFPLGSLGKWVIFPGNFSTMAWWKQMRQKEAGEGGKNLYRTGIAVHVVFWKDASVHESDVFVKPREDGGPQILHAFLPSDLACGGKMERGCLQGADNSICQSNQYVLVSWHDLVTPLHIHLVVAECWHIWFCLSQMQQPPSSSKATRKTKWSSWDKGQGFGARGGVEVGRRKRKKKKTKTHKSRSGKRDEWEVKVVCV